MRPGRSGQASHNNGLGVCLNFHWLTKLFLFIWLAAMTLRHRSPVAVLLVNFPSRGAKTFLLAIWNLFHYSLAPGIKIDSMLTFCIVCVCGLSACKHCPGRPATQPKARHSLKRKQLMY